MAGQEVKLLSCPDPEAAPKVRMYSLRKSWWIRSFRYYRRLLKWTVVSYIVVEGAVLCSDEGKIMLDWLQAPDSRLVLDSTKDFIDEKFQ